MLTLIETHYGMNHRSTESTKTTIEADAKGGEALDLMLSIISVECYYTFLSFTSLIVSVMHMNEEEVKWKISRNS